MYNKDQLAGNVFVGVAKIQQNKTQKVVDRSVERHYN